MAAHDDKTSKNRRRLIKALSSVPVVMTLNSGAAASNASSLQCARKDREDGFYKKHWSEVSYSHECNTGGMCKDSDGFVYRKMHYWKGSEAEKSSSYQGSMQCPDYVVRGHNADGSLVYVNKDGGPLSHVVRENGSYGDSLILEVMDGNQVAYRIKSRRGYGAYIGKTDYSETSWRTKGYAPKTKIGWSTEPGEHQMIRGSCMNSFLHSDTKLTNV